jgi:hypothetical protein
MSRWNFGEAHRGFCQRFFPWYNIEHHHSGIGLLTPADVHRGRAASRIAARAEVLASAYAAHPERFVRGVPQPAAAPTAVWINPPKSPPPAPGPKADLIGSSQRHDLDPGEDMGTPKNSVGAASITLSPLRALH